MVMIHMLTLRGLALSTIDDKHAHEDNIYVGCVLSVFALTSFLLAITFRMMNTLLAPNLFYYCSWLGGFGACLRTFAWT